MEASGNAELSGKSFFQNTACEHFPCHEGVDPTQFNCLFCYCPLYLLGPDCGGNFTYTGKGTKNCTPCTLPHEGTNGVALVKAKWPEILARTRKHSE